MLVAEKIIEYLAKRLVDEIVAHPIWCRSEPFPVNNTHQVEIFINGHFWRLVKQYVDQDDTSDFQKNNSYWQKKRRKLYVKYQGQRDGSANNALGKKGMWS